jgi:hypothetical protein
MLAMDFLEQRVKARGRRGYCDQVNVIQHQAIRNDLDVVLCGPFAKQSKVRVLISRTKEHLLAVVAPLRDVVRQSGKYESCASWHRSQGNAERELQVAFNLRESRIK